MKVSKYDRRQVYHTEYEAMIALSAKKHQEQWEISRLNGWYILVRKNNGN